VDGERKDRGHHERDGALPFAQVLRLVRRRTSRTEVVVTFLAMLELIRLRQIVATQVTPFGEIELAGRRNRPRLKWSIPRAPTRKPSRTKPHRPCPSRHPPSN